MAGMADDDMICNFNLHQLAGPDQIAGDFDIGFARRRVPARVIVLCGPRSYVPQVAFAPENKAVCSC